MFCSCGYREENAVHYLLHCQKYQDQRSITIKTLPPLAQNINDLLHGNSQYAIAFNKYIFLTVPDFIESSKRFDTQQ